MATFLITAPDGKKYKVTGENAEGAHAALMEMLGEAPQPTQPAQPEISTAEDVARSLGSGIVRGAIAIPETLEMAGRGIRRLGEEAYQLAGGEVEQETPVLKSTIGEALRGLTSADDYQPQTTYGEYAGTVGEFLPAAVGGPAGLARRAGVAVAAGLGSEAAGQATEGTVLEMPARIVGAFAAPSAVGRIANKTVRRSIQRPSVESLRDAKNAAYSAVDKSGVKFTTSEVDDLISRAKSSVDDFNYVPDVDLQTKAALSTVGAQAGKELTIGQLDKLRQGLYKRYNRAPEEQGIRAIIDEIDDLIEAKDPANALMTAAREANKRYKKSELLDEAFKRAERSTDVSGSGGNLVNNYRRAVASILNSKRNRKYFSSERVDPNIPSEIEVMEQFVSGTFSENTKRLIGKMAPSGNGLMQALNIGAVAYNPAMATFTAAGMLAKGSAERGALKSAEALKDMIATGAAPEKRKLITDKEIRILLGLQANEGQ